MYNVVLISAEAYPTVTTYLVPIPYILYHYIIIIIITYYYIYRVILAGTTCATDRWTRCVARAG